MCQGSVHGAVLFGALCQRDRAIFQLEAIWDARMGLLEVPEGGHWHPSMRNG